MSRIKKFLYLSLCCVITAFSLFGCQMPLQNRAKTIRYDIPSAVLSLDPQFASEASARMVISNINEGLLVRDRNGSLEFGVAESMEMSEDGKTLTFTLRDGAAWHNGAPVTAHDFVFAFRRMFSPAAPSPFAKEYLAIENAPDVLENKRAVSSLGVEAKSDDELVIRLRHPSPYFPGLLAETPAMPCNEDFFIESRGRYGIDIDFVNSNGPFYIDKWDNEAYIYIRPNENYFSSQTVLSGGVNFYISDLSPAERLRSGASDAAIIAYEDAQKLAERDFTSTEFSNTVWCIVFNQNSQLWGNPLLRQGLSLSIERGLLDGKLPPNLIQTDLFIPPVATLADRNYRQNVAATTGGFDPEQGLKLFEMGLSTLSVDRISDAAFFVPDSSDHLLAMGMVQQSWQKHLSAHINVEPTSPEQLRERFLTGDYGLMLLPLTPVTPRAETILSDFASDSPENHAGYYNALYDSLLKSILDAPDFESASAACARAETMLLHDAVIIPVYVESSALVTDSSVSGISMTPFMSRLNFKYTVKK